eukprot:gnl/MRDRNA2_/MRDRNA2_52050_c0_seq1.p1 gnl/MRDRNA2_/MRDRNA2_52050_c0~~gnl/MRDRNA2_/MRDRNA2_52050_c0_seq1.p1  ORF type:complete len:333 (+),score=59.48 gnl/MRDRNA2_/MRDRNA2_52050_c0_seq1:62-1060(+)
MAPMEDHYSVLDVGRRASFDEVKKAYRAQSKLCHPDKLSHLSEAERRAAEAKMRAVNAAYEVLSSPTQRQKYDLSFADPAQPTFRAPSPGCRAASSSCGSALRPERPVGAGMPAPGVKMKGSDKPRYMTSSKYTQRAREARRMNSDVNSDEPESSSDFNLPPRPPVFTAHSEKSVPYAAPRSEFKTSINAPPPPSSGFRASSTPAPKVYARRSDPSMYTHHVDGRSEFSAKAEAAFLQAGTQAGSSVSQPVPSPPKNPTWLQRQMDIAKKWEDMNAPPEGPTEEYQWKKASNSWLELKQRRQEREAQRRADVEAGLGDDGPRIATGSPRPEW